MTSSLPAQSLPAQELERSLSSLLRIGDKLNATYDLDALLGALLEGALELTQAGSGCAGLRTSPGMSCDLFRGVSGAAHVSHDSHPGTGWPDWVLEHGTYYLTNDAVNDVVISPGVRDRFAITSGMAIPIVDGKKNVIAFFEVFNKVTGGGFTPQDLENSLAAAQIASLAIQNVLTHNKLMALAAFSRSLALANDLDRILETVGNHLEANFHCGSVVLLPADEELNVRFQSSEFTATPQEMEAARLCWTRGEDAGASTSVAPEAKMHYRPLTVRGQVIGVLGLEFRPGAMFSTAQRELLAGFIAQSSLAIEQATLEQKLRRLRFLDESDRVRNALLTAISHEVGAPIAAITAAVTGLLHSTVPVDPQHGRQLLQIAEFEVKRLHRLMNNLLNVTRLEAGVWRVKIEPCEVSDVVGAALEELGTSGNRREVLTELSPDLPLVPMDFHLITQVFVNLLSNAAKFSSIDQPIYLRGQMIGGALEVTVVDQGIGVPEGALRQVFQKFYRLAESPSVDGLGLGLAICKEFVEAHGGRIALEHNPGGGTIARFTLPGPAQA